jgi:DNA-binding response OmpR family regulator
MGYNVLIVDDVSINIQVLAGLLNLPEYAISYATDGHQALNMVKSEDYDLILLDIMMPGIDGFEVCERIKEMPAKQDIPIIFLTARTQEQDIVQGLEAGAVDYVTKPFNSIELLARVKTHLQLKKMKDQIKKHNKTLVEKNNELQSVNDAL